MAEGEPEMIYVAGPYSAPTEDERVENTMSAIDAGIECLLKGHTPFIPHLTHFVEKRAQEIGVEIEYEEYLEWDCQFLANCDSFLHLETSPGADKEREIAEAYGLTIYNDVRQIEEVEQE